MYQMCRAFEFRHLPVAGGIYDQNPIFLQRVLYIMQAEAKWEKQKEANRNRQKGGPAPVNPRYSLPPS